MTKEMLEIGIEVIVKKQSEIKHEAYDVIMEELRTASISANTLAIVEAALRKHLLEGQQ